MHLSYLYGCSPELSIKSSFECPILLICCLLCFLDSQGKQDHGIFPHESMFRVAEPSDSASCWAAPAMRASAYQVEFIDFFDQARIFVHEGVHGLGIFLWLLFPKILLIPVRHFISQLSSCYSRCLSTVCWMFPHFLYTRSERVKRSATLIWAASQLARHEARHLSPRPRTQRYEQLQLFWSSGVGTGGWHDTAVSGKSILTLRPSSRLFRTACQRQASLQPCDSLTGIHQLQNSQCGS